MNNKKIYISDIKSRSTNGKLIGHYVPLAQNYQDIFKGTYNVIVAGGPIYKKYFNEQELQILPYNNHKDSVIEKFKTFINAIVLFWKAKGEIIVLQQSTAITSFIAIALFYWWTSKIYLIQYNTEAVNSRLKQFIYFFAKYKIDGFIVPNERVGKNYNRPYCIVTDYINCNNNLTPIPFNERLWDFSIIGTIFKDKGSIEALEYLAVKGHKILIAGGIGEKELEIPLNNILQKYPSIEHHIGFVNDSDFVRYIRYSKYCILNYQGTYFDRSSGVVLDIIFNYTPVIGTRCDALKMADEDGVGFLYSKLSEIPTNLLLEKEKHNQYIRAIEQYMIKQKKYQQKLINFLKL